MKRNFILLLLVFLTITACDTLYKAIPKPSTSIESVKLSSLNFTAAGLTVGVKVVNPYSFNLPVGGLSYDLSTSGKSLVKGDLSNLQEVPANSSSTINIPIELTFTGIKQILGDLKLGQALPYQIDVVAKLNPGGMPPLNIPMQKSGDLPIPAPPKVSLQGVDWTEVGLTKIKGSLKVKLLNNSSFEMGVAGGDCRLLLDGKNLGKASFPVSAKLIQGGVEQNLEIPIELNPMSLGPQVIQLINGGKANFGIEGKIDFNSAYGNFGFNY